MNELKSCPYCGAQAFVQRRHEYFRVECTECDASMCYATEQLCTAAWNRRTSGPATRAMLDMCRRIRKRDSELWKEACEQYQERDEVVLDNSTVDAFLAEWTDRTKDEGEDIEDGTPILGTCAWCGGQIDIVREDDITWVWCRCNCGKKAETWLGSRTPGPATLAMLEACKKITTPMTGVLVGEWIEASKAFLAEWSTPPDQPTSEVPPTFKDGEAIDITGGIDSVEYIRRMRDEWHG